MQYYLLQYSRYFLPVLLSTLLHTPLSLIARYSIFLTPFIWSLYVSYWLTIHLPYHTTIFMYTYNPQISFYKVSVSYYSRGSLYTALLFLILL